MLVTLNDHVITSILQRSRYLPSLVDETNIYLPTYGYIAESYFPEYSRKRPISECTVRTRVVPICTPRLVADHCEDLVRGASSSVLSFCYGNSILITIHILVSAGAAALPRAFNLYISFARITYNYEIVFWSWNAIGHR